MMTLLPVWAAGGGAYNPSDPFGMFSGPFGPGQPGYVFEGEPTAQTFYGRLHRVPESAAEVAQWALADMWATGGRSPISESSLAAGSTSSSAGAGATVGSVTSWWAGLSSTDKIIGGVAAGAVLVSLLRKQ